MRGFPISPFSEYYVKRSEFVTKIVKAFQKFRESAAHILIYGCGGSGKTVAVAQAVKEFLKLKENKKQYVFHWITIGKEINIVSYPTY